ncbi:MAG: histidine--tRNA ligase [Gammaproteobacteria bacterium]
MKFQSLRGMQDIFQPESRKWNQLRQVCQKVLNQYGIEEVHNPILENLNLFVRTVGDASDIVNKELYSFQDRNGDFVALRPEGTAGYIRSIIEKKIEHESQKAYYTGPMFRYERPQKGRFRQFHQLGVEYVGFAEGDADLEILALVIDLLDELKISQKASIHINHLGSSEVKQQYCNVLKDFLLGYKASLNEIDQKRLEINPLRVLDSKDESARDILALKEVPKYEEFLNDQHLQLLTNIRNTFKDRVDISIDHTLVRGLDYYTGLVFEVLSNELGAQDSFIGGGRYDNLISELGGKDQSAIGFAVGLERLLSLYKPTYMAHKKIIFINLTRSNRHHAYKIATKIRAANRKVTVESLLTEASLKSQLRKANKLGGDFALIVGDDEIANEKFIWKDLNEGTQQTVTFTQLMGTITQL